MSKQALFITHTHPLPDLDGASLRALRLLQMLRELGYAVTCLSAGRAFHSAYDARADEARTLLASHGIEAAGPMPPLDYLAAHGAGLDLIVLAVVPGSAPGLADFVAQMRRAASNATVIFDTIELTFVSMLRAARLRRSEQLARQARSVQSSQLAAAAAVDLTLVVTEEEASLLAQLCPAARIGVISNIHAVHPDPPPIMERRDLIFVGNYVHMPNRDAAQHFAADVWPQIRPHLPDAVVRFVGLPVPEVAALAAPDVIVMGHIPDLAPLYAASRVAIAPLRFGAGIKGKVLEAMGYGLPVVMTPVAAEGTHAIHDEHALIAGTPSAFAAAVVALYQDTARWQQLSRAGQRLVEEHFSYAAVKARLAALLAEIEQPK